MRSLLQPSGPAACPVGWASHSQSHTGRASFEVANSCYMAIAIAELLSRSSIQPNVIQLRVLHVPFMLAVPVLRASTHIKVVSCANTAATPRLCLLHSDSARETNSATNASHHPVSDPIVQLSDVRAYSSESSYTILQSTQLAEARSGNVAPMHIYRTAVVGRSLIGHWSFGKSPQHCSIALHVTPHHQHSSKITTDHHC
jgi:hypothetical protein